MLAEEVVAVAEPEGDTPDEKIAEVVAVARKSRLET